MRLIDADKMVFTREDYVGALTLQQRLKRQLDAQPTVEAIPVEWINEKLDALNKKIWSKKIGAEELKNLLIQQTTLMCLIDTWEKENGIRTD